MKYLRRFNESIRAIPEVEDIFNIARDEGFIISYDRGQFIEHNPDYLESPYDLKIMKFK